MTSLMRAEALQAPAAVARLLAGEGGRLQALGAAWRARPPAQLMTVARGSSDHAAHFFGYLVMARLGRLVASLPMSVVTLYQAQLRAQGLAALAFSQSGQSPDLVAPIAHVRERGGITVALVNEANSPLAQAAEHVLPLHAGGERSVAATKSFITQLVAGAALVAAWQDDAPLQRALQALPAVLDEAAALDWSAAIHALADLSGLYVIGRGTGLPVAMELALKFKEVCGLHAEAFSGAELRHGPLALVQPGFVVLVLAPPGPAQAGLLTLADDLRQGGARVLLAAPVGVPGAELPLQTTADADLDPIAVAMAAYPMIEALARERGRDPDRPPHLSKITRTR